jgi:AcrR family transcriptional regulator
MKSKPTGEPRGRPRAFCTDTALDAATRVFGEKGYEGASLSDLTDAMGINRPSMYAAFGNKEELFLKSVERYSEAGIRHVAECLASGTAREGVERLLRDGVTKFTAPNGSGACFVTQGPLASPEISEEGRRQLEHWRAAIEITLKRRFDRALEAGQLPRGTSSADLARFYSVMVQGLALQAQHGGTREQLLRVVDVAMRSWPAKATARKPSRRRA